jgi:hypothetical protein
VAEQWKNSPHFRKLENIVPSLASDSFPNSSLARQGGTPRYSSSYEPNMLPIQAPTSHKEGHIPLCLAYDESSETVVLSPIYHLAYGRQQQALVSEIYPTQFIPHFFNNVKAIRPLFQCMRQAGNIDRPGTSRHISCRLGLLGVQAHLYG